MRAVSRFWQRPPDDQSWIDMWESCMDRTAFESVWHWDKKPFNKFSTIRTGLVPRLDGLLVPPLTGSRGRGVRSRRSELPAENRAWLL